jgi:putative transposase
VRRSPIAYDDFDRRWFFDDFAKIVAELEWRCHAYCLMTNHYHLLVRTREADLSKGMFKLNQRHAIRINRRRGFSGHVFEGRFYAELIEDEAHFVALARYIDQNPVRAGLCDTPEQWPWSGCAATVGARSVPAFFDPTDVLAYYSADITQARVAYALSLQNYDRPVGSGRVLSPGLGTRLDQPKP